MCLLDPENDRHLSVYSTPTHGGGIKGLPTCTEHIPHYAYQQGVSIQQSVILVNSINLFV